MVSKEMFFFKKCAKVTKGFLNESNKVMCVWGTLPHHMSPGPSDTEYHPLVNSQYITSKLYAFAVLWLLNVSLYYKPHPHLVTLEVLIVGKHDVHEGIR